MDIRQQGVIRFEPGIIEKEGIYFHTASAFAQQHLFYGLWGARYLCSAPYDYQGQSHLLEHNGALFSKQYGLEKDFQKIMQMLPLDANADDRMSVVIHHILSSLNTQGHAAHNVSPQIQAAKDWMDEHFHENIQIEEVAAQVSLSRFYFSRRFREETGLSPHEYLLNLRLSYAKLQLSESDDSIEEIAYDCAFCSASNLIRAFKKSTGLTPYQFRKTVFITTH